MANIVNGGAIVLVAVFGLVAIVGAADEFREAAGSDSRASNVEPDAASRRGNAHEAPEARDVGTPVLAKGDLGDQRDGGRGDGDHERGKDKDDDRHDKDDDEKDDEDDD